MIITIAPTVFKDSSRSDSDILLNRILQLVIQVLSRVTVPPSCFQYVIDLCLPDLTGVTHFSIITASLGIILALMQDELDIDARALKVCFRLLLNNNKIILTSLSSFRRSPDIS